MTKILKWVIVAITTIGFSMVRCGVKDKLEKHEKAKANADFIMNHLNKQEVIDQFPEKYFPRQQFVPFLETLTKNCDLDTKRGKFIDFFNMVNDGKNQTAYIYEYILNCDSLRFIYIYNLEPKEPELFKVTIEGLEQENKMIIDHSKQLLN